MINSLRSPHSQSLPDPLLSHLLFSEQTWNWFEGYQFPKGGSQSCFSEQAPASGDHCLTSRSTHSVSFLSTPSKESESRQGFKSFGWNPILQLLLDSWLDDWDLNVDMFLDFTSTVSFCWAWISESQTWSVFLDTKICSHR